MSHSTHVWLYYDFGVEAEIRVDLEYSISRYYPATRYQPAEGGEAEITDAWALGLPFSMTPDQERRWTAYIEENHTDEGPDPDAAYEAMRERAREER